MAHSQPYLDKLIVLMKSGCYLQGSDVWYHLVMSLSSVVFAGVCMEEVTEIKGPYYLIFHPWLMND